MLCGVAEHTKHINVINVYNVYIEINEFVILSTFIILINFT